MLENRQGPASEQKPPGLEAGWPWGGGSEGQGDNTAAALQGELGGAKAGEKAGVAAGQSQPGPRVAGSLHPGFEGGTEGPQLCLRRWEGARGWEEGLWGPPRSAPDLHGAPPQMTYCVRSPALQLVERSEPSD